MPDVVGANYELVDSEKEPKPEKAEKTKKEKEPKPDKKEKTKDEEKTPKPSKAKVRRDRDEFVNSCLTLGWCTFELMRLPSTLLLLDAPIQTPKPTYDNSRDAKTPKPTPSPSRSSKTPKPTRKPTKKVRKGSENTPH